MKDANKFIQNLVAAAAVASLLLLAGCTTAPQIQTYPEAVESDSEPSVKESEPDAVIDKAPPKAPVLARDAEEDEVELSAVTYLLDQAQNALNNSELDKASAFLDRALKIDRKSPRAYLILAQTQQLKNNPSQALASARQGLLYTSERSAVGRQLKALIRRFSSDGN